MTSAFATRPVQLVELAAVTPAVEAKVAAWRLAREAREAAWTQYKKLSDEHNRKVQFTKLPSGRKPRRSREFVAAEQLLDRFEHRASHAEAEIEMELRAANPGADNRTIMATKRALTGPEQ